MLKEFDDVEDFSPWELINNKEIVVLFYFPFTFYYAEHALKLIFYH